MALYAIGDLHLCLGAPKPMDIFGGAWVGYMDKLKEGMSVITPEDTTVLLGDLSLVRLLHDGVFCQSHGGQHGHEHHDCQNQAQQTGFRSSHFVLPSFAIS